MCVNCGCNNCSGGSCPKNPASSYLTSDGKIDAPIVINGVEYPVGTNLNVLLQALSAAPPSSVERSYYSGSIESSDSVSGITDLVTGLEFEADKDYYIHLTVAHLYDSDGGKTTLLSLYSGSDIISDVNDVDIQAFSFTRSGDGDIPGSDSGHTLFKINLSEGITNGTLKMASIEGVNIQWTCLIEKV